MTTRLRLLKNILRTDDSAFVMWDTVERKHPTYKRGPHGGIIRMTWGQFCAWQDCPDICADRMLVEDVTGGPLAALANIPKCECGFFRPHVVLSDLTGLPLFTGCECGRALQEPGRVG